MTRVGLRIPNEIGGRYSMPAVEALAERADELGYDSLWVPESAARNSFMVLGRLASVTDDVRLGTGIVNVFSRSPALIAMSVATLSELSDGRAMLGIGASSRAAIEEWHAMAFDRPLRRIRETIEIVRQALEDDRVDYHGEIFDVDDYPTRLGPPGQTIPIYNAALGETNRRLTAEYADGWLPIHVPRRDFPTYIEEMRVVAAGSGRNPDELTIAPYIVSCVSATDPDGARERVREVIAFYVGAMEYYAGVFRRFGFETEVENITSAWENSDREAARAAVTDSLLDDVAIAGSPEAGRRRLAAYREAGVDVPIVALPASLPQDVALETIEALGPP